jgi:hypothetical protein
LVFSTVNHEEIMTAITQQSFFARLRQKFFDRAINYEIFDRIFPHLEREKNWGYFFSTDEEMEAQTEELDAAALLASIERQILRMPKAYGKAFRHVLHRELHRQLRRYEQAARRRVQPESCDPRHIATRA